MHNLASHPAAPASKLAPVSTMRDATIDIVEERRRADCHLQHGMKVKVVSEDPEKPGRYMVQVPGFDNPISLSGTIVKLD